MLIKLFMILEFGARRISGFESRSREIPISPSALYRRKIRKIIAIKMVDRTFIFPRADSCRRNVRTLNYGNKVYPLEKSRVL
jgi:hypothetical protein